MPPPGERLHRRHVGTASRIWCVAAAGLWVPTVVTFVLTSPADGVDIGGGLLGMMALTATVVTVALIARNLGAPPGP